MNNAALIAQIIINWPKKDRKNLSPERIIERFIQLYPERINPNAKT